jgi:hypothetical protein
MRPRNLLAGNRRVLSQDFAPLDGASPLVVTWPPFSAEPALICRTSGLCQAFFAGAAPSPCREFIPSSFNAVRW